MDKRSTDLAIRIMQSEEEKYGHEAMPLLKHLCWKAYQFCVLHALMAMGRLLLNWLYNFLILMEQLTSKTDLWNYAATWLSALNTKLILQKSQAIALGIAKVSSLL